MPILSLLVVPEVVIMITYSTTREDRVDNVATLSFQVRIICIAILQGDHDSI